mmetsp:Transcript_11721/g.19055  ORF Transcript_11721/g.19055 Transcript_11721/m.19055 type:complete len:510 (+) Transcript_11721:86-1615(+)|eukprot:CAMPEP_0184652126 /NCGR_PEP_ID=MMETSP0308-20130426/9806_1 /TAXON_ID=38269 /ORGANISM="Gloeochaete witrockiana, Strain SAG 46.84" /LENGTH=509 /DNA_ID=CAMNT_0027086807 /DNA_START=48 /DNA_END=1577 /DNA_ORIENTATION=+
MDVDVELVGCGSLTFSPESIMRGLQLEETVAVFSAKMQNVGTVLVKIFLEDKAVVDEKGPNSVDGKETDQNAKVRLGVHQFRSVVPNDQDIFFVRFRLSSRSLLFTSECRLFSRSLMLTSEMSQLDSDQCARWDYSAVFEVDKSHWLPCARSEQFYIQVLRMERPDGLQVLYPSTPMSREVAATPDLTTPSSTFRVNESSPKTSSDPTHRQQPILSFFKNIKPLFIEVPSPSALLNRIRPLLSPQKASMAQQALYAANATTTTDTDNINEMMLFSSNSLSENSRPLELIRPVSFKKLMVHRESSMSDMPKPERIPSKYDEYEFYKYAAYMGVDPKRDSEDLVKVVNEAWNATLPTGWTEHLSPGRLVYFYNEETDSSQWTHPLDESYRQRISYLKSPPQTPVTRTPKFTNDKDDTTELDDLLLTTDRPTLSIVDSDLLTTDRMMTHSLADSPIPPSTPKSARSASSAKSGRSSVRKMTAMLKPLLSSPRKLTAWSPRRHHHHHNRTLSK